MAFVNELTSVLLGAVEALRLVSFIALSSSSSYAGVVVVWGIVRNYVWPVQQ